MLSQTPRRGRKVKQEVGFQVSNVPMLVTTFEPVKTPHEELAAGSSCLVSAWGACPATGDTRASARQARYAKSRAVNALRSSGC
eukprot:1002962-Pleurochrysis_carterae.AAC.1